MFRTVNASGRLLLALLASVLTGLLLAAVALPVVGGLGLAAKASADEFLVLPGELVTTPPPVRSRLVATNGATLAWLYRENRIPVPLEQIPKLTQQALISIEDARFYQHNGVDYKGTARAAVENVRNSGVTQGGSTLTQQYVKNALIQTAKTKKGQLAARETSIDRKLKEARYALALEQRLSKDEILQKYFNIAYFGNGAYGLGAAASFYFGGATVDKLTLAQGATLAGMVQSPTRFDPVRALKEPKVMTALLDRRDLVLHAMADQGYITEQQRAAAVAEKSTAGKPLFTIRRIRAGCENPAVRAPFFCDYVRYVLERTDLGASLGKTLAERQNALLGGGLTIQTSLDVNDQAAAQKAATDAIPVTDPFATAINIVQPGTGYIKAMAVNRNYSEAKGPGNTKVNLAVGGSGGFQAGSTFKAFVLAAALKQGIPLGLTLQSPQTYTSKVFIDYKEGRKVPYKVSNAGDSESGTFDMRTATADSVNTYFLQLEERTGVEAPASLAESMGVRQLGGSSSGKLTRGGSFTLGANDVSPLAMAGAYATFAARGLYCPPNPVVRITFPDGKLVEPGKGTCKQVLDQGVADTVNSVLSGVIDGPQSGRTGRAASLGRPAAGKTGTTNGSKAAWFIGYTPKLAASVWVGYPGGPGEPVREMRYVTVGGRYYRVVYGGTIPAPIWRETMQGALQDVPRDEFVTPDQLTTQGEKVAIPDVQGMSLSDAKRTLTQAGFAVNDGGRVSGAGTRSGTAAYTSPKAGRERAYGTSVTLFESNGRRRASSSATPGALTAALPPPGG